MTLWAAVTGTATVAQTGLNIAMRANVIGLVVTALAVLAAGMIVAYQKSETFRDTVKAALGAVQTAGEAVADVFRWFRDHAGVVMDVLSKHPSWLLLKLAISNVDTDLDAVKAAFIWLRDKGGTAIAALWKAAKPPLDAVVDAIRAIIDAVKDVIGWISKIKLPSMPDLNPFGSEVGKVSPTTSAVSGVTSKLWDEIALGQGMGLTMTSGLRSGDPGDHGRGHAIDMSGPASTMATYAMALMGRAGIKDVIYGGLSFWQDNGRRITTWAGNQALRGDHFETGRA